MEALEEAVRTAYSKQNSKAQISPAIIAIIIELLMGIIGGCMKNKNAATIKDDIERRPIFSRVAVRWAMRQSGLLNKPESRDIMETVMDLAKQSTEQNINDLYEKSQELNIG